MAMRKTAGVIHSLVLSLVAVSSIEARDVKAILCMREGGAPQRQAPYVEVVNLKISQDDAIRIGEQAQVNKNEHGRLSKLDFNKLQWIEWVPGDERVRVLLQDGSRRSGYGYPAKSQLKGADSMDASALRVAVLTGERVAGKKKTKFQATMTEVQAILFIDQSAEMDSAVFVYAKTKRSPKAMQDFMRHFPQSLHVAAAGEEYVNLQYAAAEKAYQSFERESSLRSLKQSRELLKEALAFKDDARCRELESRAAAAAEKVEEERNRFISRVESQQWDSALDAFDPIRKYAGELEGVPAAEKRARQGSHDLHLKNAEEHRKAGRFQAAMSAYKMALSRVSSPEASAGLRETGVLLALQIAENQRATKNYDAANGTLVGSIKEWGEDQRTTALLSKVNGEWAQTVHAKAKPVFTPPKASLDRATEQKYVAALEQMETVAALNPRPGLPVLEKDIHDLRRRLAVHSLKTGQAKLQQLPKGSSSGQALLYLKRGHAYDPSVAGLPEAVSAASTAFQQKRTIAVAVATLDKTPRRACGHIAEELSGAIGSAISGANLPGVELVERDRLAELLREPETGGVAGSPGGPRRTTAKVLSDIITCESKLRETAVRVPSQYISGYRENPEYGRLLNLKGQYEARIQELDRMDDPYRDCAEQEKKQGIHGQCREFRDKVSRESSRVSSLLSDVTSALENAPQQFPIYTRYTYGKRTLALDVRFKLSYRFADSITGVIREQQLLGGESSLSDLEIEGAMDTDTSGVRNKGRSILSEEEALNQQVQKARAGLEQAVLSHLRSLPDGYLQRARKASERNAVDEAVENYILYLGTVASPSVAERNEAQDYLKKQRDLRFSADVLEPTT